MKNILKFKIKFTGHTQEGATSVEYAIIGALIAAVIVTVVTSVGSKTLANFASVMF